MRLEAAEAKQVALEASVREQREAPPGNWPAPKNLRRRQNAPLGKCLAASPPTRPLRRRRRKPATRPVRGDQLLSELSSVQEQIRARNAQLRRPSVRQPKRPPVRTSRQPPPSGQWARTTTRRVRPAVCCCARRRPDQFGVRQPIPSGAGVWRYHNGVDYAASCGTPVLAGNPAPSPASAIRVARAT